MEKVKIVVVEDEILFAEELVDTLQNLGYEVYGPAISFSEGIDLISQVNPDLILTDIELSGKKTGIDLAREVRKLFEIPFIYLTSFSDKETIDLARENKPNAYLTKPYNTAELYAAIELAIDSFYGKKVEKLLVVKTKDCYIKIDVNDIVFVQSDHVYLELNTEDKKYVIRQSLTDFLAKYEDKFVRVHKSYLVNLNFVDRFDSNFVFIKNLEIPIGKQYAHDAISRIQDKLM